MVTTTSGTPRSSEEYSFLFSSAGIWMMGMENYPAATELFRSALQMDQQSQGLDLRNHDGDVQHIAVSHLQRMEILLASTGQEAEATSLAAGTSSTAQHGRPTTASSSSPVVAFPYLVTAPIDLLEDIPDDRRLYSASILFNLGLSLQLQNQPQSSQVPLLYHRATVALCDVVDSNETFTMSVAILNNTGVWCHANGGGDDDDSGVPRGRSCIESLAQLLLENYLPGGEGDTSSSLLFHLDASVVSEQGVLANIRELLSDETSTTSSPTSDDNDDGTISMASPAA